jgi:hypothetical protein
MSYKKWTKYTILLIIILTIGIILFNYIINPYYVFNTNSIKRINNIKDRTISDAMTKFYCAKKANPNLLLIGTSRTEHINPKYIQQYYKGKIYNLAIKGSGIAVHKKNIDYFIKHNKIDTIIYGLDFFSYNPYNNRYNENLTNTRYNDVYIKDYKDSLLSFTTFIKSIGTLKDSLKNIKVWMQYNNGYDSYSNKFEVKKHGNKIIKKAIKKEVMKESSKKQHFKYDYFKTPKSINQGLKTLDYIINTCHKHHIKLYLFISPIYKDITNIIYTKGYDKTYEYWKKNLAKYGNIYDFSGYNSITKDYTNYLDGSHYQKKIGNMIIDKLFNNDNKKIPKDFGIILNKQNINKVLKQTKKYYNKEKSAGTLNDI